MKKQILLALLSCGLMLLGGCAKSTSPSTQGLTIRIGGEPALLNPILSKDTTCATVEKLIFNGLMRVNDELQIEPDLAEKYSLSADGKVYTFTLKKNVKWQDGHPFTAHDVAFTIEKILDPKTLTVRRSDFQVNGKSIQVRIQDEHTLQFILPEPFAPFLSNLTLGILPKHLLAGKDINTATFNHQPIGTGPFKWVNWQPSQYITLAKNPLYFGKSPKLAKIIVKIIPENNAARVAFEKKEVHMLGIEPHDKATFEKRSDMRVLNYDTLAYTYMSFNLKNPLFSDIRVRQAITYAVNKEAIVQNVLMGEGKAAYWPDSPASWAYPGDDAAIKMSYNPQKAKALLAQAGWIYNPKTQRVEKDGKPFVFTVLLGKGQTDREKTAQIVQQFLKQVGIEMKIQLMEWGSLVKTLTSPQLPKKFDAALLGWSLNTDPDCLSIWHSGEFPTGFNFIGYANPKVDSGLVLARKTPSQAQRKKIYTEIYTQIAQDAPYLFLYYPKAVSGVYKTVKGTSKPGPAGLLNTIEGVYIE
jgi:peptide/nickel transport system substrate-binding protein